MSYIKASLPEMEMMGHNNPPAPTVLEAHSANADDLFSTVSGSTASPITTDAQEEALTALLDDVKKGKAAADESCEAEYRPHKAAADQVKADYKPVLGKFDKATQALKDALTPYRAAKQKAKDEAARIAREEAAQKLEAAQKALQTSDDLESRFEAEEGLKQAARLTASANRIDRSATGLRTFWTHQITDRRAFLNYVAKHDPDALTEFLDAYARGKVNSGVRVLPGVLIQDEKRAA